MNHRILRLATLALMFSSTLAMAYEVDNFTDRDTLKVDSLPKLNEKVNRILDRAVSETRKEMGAQCSKAKLRQEVLRWIRPDPTGQLEFWMELSDELDHTHIGVSKSVYRDVSFWDSPILKVAGIGRLILLNGSVIGTDKVGHFFYQGLAYFDLVQEGKPLEKVLAENHAEDGLWGLKTSGVFSYADMAANYQGYRFWDQFTRGENPYFKCVQGIGWVKARNFTWADYVNSAWDEAINCSEFRKPIERAFEAALAKRGLKCPLVPRKCEDISHIDHAQYFTSPKCAPSLIASGLSPRR
ncbi:MAG: hypothetical protein HYW49_08205 [Deltaproteobacteria bacterium]|nr:hypothetical protein [Deltaproteobacteria bacterium]